MWRSRGFPRGLTVARYLSEGCPHDVHTIGAVTTDTSATKVFRREASWDRDQCLERCRIRVVSSLT